jgi:hypothetical protein
MGLDLPSSEKFFLSLLFLVRWLAVWFLMGALPAAAQGSGAAGTDLGTTRDPYVVPRIEPGIRVDAVLDEPGWEKALVLELNYEVHPGENVAPPVRTEVLLSFDGRHLNVAFRCYDPDPSAIRAHLSDRDRLGNDDWVSIALDTFNDQRRSFTLVANPLGVQEDYIQTEAGQNGSWDAIWDSAGRITDWGYIVEASIPFNQLRFQRSGSPQIWGFDGVRSYPRSQSHLIGAFPRDRSNNCYLCQAVKIEGFEGLSPGHNIEIVPTLTAVRTDARSDFPEGNLEREDQDADLGVTARWGMTPNLTLTGALNPDFSQVEADAMQLNVNQPFALYYPERRPFFTESADFYGTLKSAVYTRTMRDPSWGLKLSGKERANTIGAYVVRDDLTNLIFPGSQGSDSTSLMMESTASVLRYKRDFSDRHTLGALLTDREGEGYANRVLGLDGDFRLSRTDQIQIQFLQSSTRYPDAVTSAFGQPEGSFSGRFIAFEYDHESRTVGWWLDYDNVGTDFRADLGFIPRVGFRNVEGGCSYNWNARPGSRWARLRVGCEVNHYEDQDGDLLSRGGSGWFYYEGALQSWFFARGYKFREAYNDVEFDLGSYLVEGGFSPSGDLSMSISSRFGDHIDYANTRPGDRFFVSPSIVGNLGSHLRLAFWHVFERLNVEGGRLYRANITNLSATYHFNVRTLFRSILQYVDYRYTPELYTFNQDPEFKHLFGQLLFSYKINPRTVFFLGYSDNYFGGQEFGLTQSDRTIFAKLGYAWML